MHARCNKTFSTSARARSTSNPWPSWLLVCVQPCNQGFQPSTSFLLRGGAEGVRGWLCPSKLPATPQVNVPALVCAWTLYRVAGRALTLICPLHFVLHHSSESGTARQDPTSCLHHLIKVAHAIPCVWPVWQKSSLHLHAPRHPWDVNASLKHQRYSGA